MTFTVADDQAEPSALLSKVVDSFHERLAETAEGLVKKAMAETGLGPDELVLCHENVGNAVEGYSVRLWVETKATNDARPRKPRPPTD